MTHHGDYAAGATVVFDFTTAVNGVPTALAGTPALSVYKNSTTESTAGITLTASYDSRTGMNHVVIDTSADATFYAGGNHFSVVITAGTVGGESVVGYVVGSFTLGVAQTANVTQVNGAAQTATLDTIKSDTAAILADTGADGVVVAAASKTGYALSSSGLDAVTAWTVAITGNITGNLSGSVGSVTGNVGGNVTGSVGSLATQAKADVNAEVDTALADINLDHLVKSAVDTNFATTVHLDSVIGHLADVGTTATFDRTTDALEAVRGALDTVDTEIETIDTVVDAIKAKTDSLTFTAAGNVDANVQYVNDVAVTGVGSEANPWGPA